MQANKKAFLKLFSLFCFLNTSLLLSGCQKQTAPVAPGPTEVTVYMAQTQPITMTTLLPGRTMAYALAEVRPQVGGIILKRYFSEGSEVRAGQPLYQIDPTLYHATHNSAKAALAKAQANATSTQLKANNYKALVAEHAVSRQEYIDAIASMKQSRADILINQAAVDTARLNLLYTEVKAPINGRIGRALATQGTLVTAEKSPVLAIIQQLDPIYVDIQQSSTDYLRLHQALKEGILQTTDPNSAKILLIKEDGTEYPLAGKLLLSDVNVDPSTSSITVRAIFPNPEGLLLPGTFVRAKLTEGINNKGILLPQIAVMRDQRGDPYAFIVDKNNTVSSRKLRVGQAINDQWIILSGIITGDKVIIEGLQKVKPGQIVKPVESLPPPTAMHKSNQALLAKDTKKLASSPLPK